MSARATDDDVSELAAENGRLRAALKLADASIARFCSHQVGYQTAYVDFREARFAIRAALADVGVQTNT